MLPCWHLWLWSLTVQLHVVVHRHDHPLTGHLAELFGDWIINERTSWVVDMMDVEVEPQEPHELSAGRLYTKSGTTASLVLGQGTPPGVLGGITFMLFEVMGSGKYNKAYVG